VTQELAEVALAFCRECLHWQNPHAEGGKRPNVFSYSNDRVLQGTLYYTNLASVFSAVRVWCEANGLGWSMESEGKGVRVMVLGEYREVGVTGEDVCGVMMGACLGWVRQLGDGE
jgi:hypothetical protein